MNANDTDRAYVNYSEPLAGRFAVEADDRWAPADSEYDEGELHEAPDEPSWLGILLVIAVTLAIGIAIGVGATLMLRPHAKSASQVANPIPPTVAPPLSPSASPSAPLYPALPRSTADAAPSAQQILPPPSVKASEGAKPKAHRAVRTAKARPPPKAKPVRQPPAKPQVLELEAPH
jgi:hypothetical protein